jgi:hypothetical protein
MKTTKGGNVVAKNALRTTQRRFSTDEMGSAVKQVQEFIGDVLTKGTAVDISIVDDRGGQGTINVYVTQPRG